VFIVLVFKGHMQLANAFSRSIGHEKWYGSFHDIGYFSSKVK